MGKGGCLTITADIKLLEKKALQLLSSLSFNIKGYYSYGSNTDIIGFFKPQKPLTTMTKVILEVRVDPLDTKKIEGFLNERLKLSLHPNKIVIRKLNQGIDFLGYVILSHYRTLRTKTKRRMLKKANIENESSYLGLLHHCNAYKLTKELKSQLVRRAQS